MTETIGKILRDYLKQTADRMATPPVTLADLNDARENRLKKDTPRDRINGVK